MVSSAMSYKSKRYKCPQCGEIYIAPRRICPICSINCIEEKGEQVRSQGIVVENLDEAESVFLSRARRYKSNDGKIDQDERNELVDLALAMGIDSVRREALIELAECEFESESKKLKTGDSSDGHDRKFAFMDWTRWRHGPLKKVRSFVGRVRAKSLAIGIVRTEDRGFGGVCSAIATRFAINVKLFRAVALAIAILCPYLIPVYFVFWSLLPNKDDKLEFIGRL